MRMTASWSGSDRTYRIQVGGAKMRLNGKLPSNHHSDRRRQTLELRRKARLPVHPPSACSGLKALRNTSLAKAASRQAALAFRSLDPFRALREPDPRRRDEERPSRSEQRTLSKNQKQRLDRKSPIQVRIHFPPALSHVRTRLPRSVGRLASTCLDRDHRLARTVSNPRQSNSTPCPLRCPRHFTETTARPFLPHPRHRRRPLRSRTSAAALSPALSSASGVSSARGGKAAQ
jgi:hypothetical protein